MDKITPAVIVALIVGSIIGYLISGVTRSPQNLQSEKARTMSETQNTSASTKPGSKEAKIQNAMSAAPEAVAKDASVFDWPEKEGGELVELRKGTNDWTCLPDTPTSPGNDPICADKQAIRWFQAYMSQTPPILTQVGIGYMLQGGSDASNTDPFATKPAEGEDWLSAPAHVMVFPVGKLDASIYGTDPKKGGSWIMYAGTPYEHLMVPVK